MWGRSHLRVSQVGWGQRGTQRRTNWEFRPRGWGSARSHQLLPPPTPPTPQWAGVLSRLALEQERILNPLLDRVRTADHHQLRPLTGLTRNLSRNARNKDEMCELGHPKAWVPSSPCLAGLTPGFSLLLSIWAGLWQLELGAWTGLGGPEVRRLLGVEVEAGFPSPPDLLASRQPPRW